MKTNCLWILAIVVLGCVTAGPRRWFSGSCTGQGVCGEAGLCIEGQCARSCASQSDCDEGICVQKHCMLPERACATGICLDGNQCTDDFCNITTGACRHDPGTGTCSDGDGCTMGDECVMAGDGPICKAAPKCDDGDPSTADSCDKATGSCGHAAP